MKTETLTAPDPEYLEHERLAAVAQDSQKQGEFLEWCLSKRYVAWVTSGKSTSDLLAEYYGIDQKKLEKEKRVMLAAIRK